MSTHVSRANTALAKVFLGELWPPTSANLAWGMAALLWATQRQTSLSTSTPANPLPPDSHVSIDI